MRKLIALLVVVLVVTVVGASLALAQGAQPEPDVEVVTTAIDGVSRTVTVTFVQTGVLSVEVGPALITETFDLTATAWLGDLFGTFDDLRPNDTGSADKIRAQWDELLDKTETVRYPASYTPFFRQFRFAIYTCRDWVNFHETVTKDDQGAIFAVGPYVTLQSACKNRYQEAYVEMERIVHGR